MSDKYKYKDYSTKEIEKLLYNIANKFHSAGNLSNLDLIYVSVPTILIKRIMDLREDYIESTLKRVDEYVDGICSLNDIYLDKEKEINPLFFVHNTVDNNENGFFLTYDDIIEYQPNPDSTLREIHLTVDNTLVYKTRARNKVALWIEVCKHFSSDKITNVFEHTRYFKNYLNDRLTNDDMDGLLTKFGQVYFGENIKTDIFSKAYIYLITEFANGMGNGGQFFTPEIICEIAIGCLEPELQSEGKTNVCDITAGSATFLVEIAKYLSNKYGETRVNERLHIFMQEKVDATLMIGEAGLLLAGLQFIEAFAGNSLTEYQDNIGQYRDKMHYFIGNPPYGSKIMQPEDYSGIQSLDHEERWSQWGIPNKSQLEWFFVQTMVDMLAPTGRGAVVLPTGSLSKDNSKSLMIEQDMIEGVITLPDKMFHTTSIATCIVFINKQKREQDKGRVFLFDTKAYQSKNGTFNTVDKEKVIELYTQRRAIEDKDGVFNEAISVDLETLRNNNYNISPSHYLDDGEEDEKLDIEQIESEMLELYSKISNQLFWKG